MRRVALLFVVLTACSSDSTDGTQSPADPLPLTTGTYAGSYRVPTVSEDLAAAATFDVEEVHWTVAAGVVTLEYDLPVGLVGGDDVEVALSGAATSGTRELAVSGETGVGTCTAAGTIVTCTEDLANLGTLPIDATVVSQRAAIEYAGPADHRIEVANVFGSDPIGIVVFDLSAVSDDDHGGNGND